MEEFRGELEEYTTSHYRTVEMCSWKLVIPLKRFCSVLLLGMPGFMQNGS